MCTCVHANAKDGKFYISKKKSKSIFIGIMDVVGDRFFRRFDSSNWHKSSLISLFLTPKRIECFFLISMLFCFSSTFRRIHSFRLHGNGWCRQDREKRANIFANHQLLCRTSTKPYTLSENERKWWKNKEEEETKGILFSSLWAIDFSLTPHRLPFLSISHTQMTLLSFTLSIVVGKTTRKTIKEMKSTNKMI